MNKIENNASYIEFMITRSPKSDLGEYCNWKTNPSGKFGRVGLLYDHVS